MMMKPELHKPTNNPELDLPVVVNLSDRFWIDPSAIWSVRDMINSARLSTMVLGVESRRSDIMLASPVIEPLLEDHNDPRFTDRRRAAEVGMMYGSLLADTIHGEVRHDVQDIESMPEGLVDDIAAAKNGLDVRNERDTYNLFMRLRDIEVAYTGSDVLAFCLAATQDHMAHLFMNSHQTEDDKLTRAQVLELQSLYYAGVLLGAMANTSEELPKQQIEIMRRRRNPVEQVGARIQFDATDDLEHAIEYHLRSKYSFMPAHAEGKSAVAVLPCGVQFAPNELSMPMLIPGFTELGMTNFVPSKSIDALLLQNEQTEDADYVHFRLERNVGDYLDGKADVVGDVPASIVGLIVDDSYISAIDAGHPWAPALEQFIQREMKRKARDLTYVNEVQLWNKLQVKRASRIQQWGFGAALIGCWAQDVYGLAAIPGYKVGWTQGAAASAAVVGLAGLYRHFYNRMAQRETQSAQNFDRLLQNFADTIPLQDT